MVNCTFVCGDTRFDEVPVRPNCHLDDTSDLNREVEFQGGGRFARTSEDEPKHDHTGVRSSRVLGRRAWKIHRLDNPQVVWGSSTSRAHGGIHKISSPKTADTPGYGPCGWHSRCRVYTIPILWSQYH